MQQRRANAAKRKKKKKKKDGTWLESEEDKGLGKKWGTRREEQMVPHVGCEQKCQEHAGGHCKEPDQPTDFITSWTGDSWVVKI